MPVLEKSLDQILTAYEHAQSADGVGLCRLSGQALFRVSGADARDFLSRQLSCDVSKLTTTHSVHGAWLSAKGRVQALVRLIEQQDGIVMLLDAAVAEPALARMRMFVLRSEVRIEAVPMQRVIGLMSPSRAELAPPWMPAAAGDAGLACTRGPLTLVKLAADDSRILILGSESELEKTCAELLALGVPVVDEAQWNRLEVQAGVPRLDAANIDAFIPQMLNLDLTHGVSFSKGCYPGQEIVARTQHLGRIKRRMFRAQAMGNGNPIAPGISVYAAVTPDMAIGRVVRSAPGADGRSLLLAVIALDNVLAGDTLTINGVTLEEVTEPPYGLAPNAH